MDQSRNYQEFKTALNKLCEDANAESHLEILKWWNWMKDTVMALHYGMHFIIV
jgi:hypothetical protein